MREDHTMSNWVGSLPLPPKKPDSVRSTGKTRPNASSKSGYRSPSKERKAIGNDGKNDPPRKLQAKPPPPPPPLPPRAFTVQVPKKVNSNLLFPSITISVSFVLTFQQKDVFNHLIRPFGIRARGESLNMQ